MSATAWLLASLNTRWQHITSYYRTYPCISENSDLCSYYRKYNKSTPASLVLVTLIMVFAEVIRLYMLVLSSDQPWEYIRKVLIVWTLMNVAMVIVTYQCMQLRNSMMTAANKTNLETQRVASWRMEFFASLPVCVLAIAPLILPVEGREVDVINLSWMYNFHIGLQICVWTLNSLIYKALVITLFNVIYCGICYYNGYFLYNMLGRTLMPPILSLTFFIAFDRFTKENFILKRTLKQQKNMYEKHLEKVQDPVVILSQSKLLFCNQAGKQRIGGTMEEFWNKTSFIVSSKGESLSEALKLRLENAHVTTETAWQDKYFMHNLESDVIAYDNVMLVTVIESSMFAREKIVSLAFHDMTQELIQEENRVEEKYKNMLLFSLSHELRTPLNVFQALFVVLKDLPMTEEQTEIMKHAKGEWRYLRNKISDILDYAQLLMDEFVLHKSPFSLHRFVHRLHKVARSLLQKKSSSIRMDFSVDNAIKEEFFGDRDRLEQVLFNLISNATKYTESGTITLRVFYTTADRKTLTFEVRDTGCGMTPELLNELAEERCRAESIGSAHIVRKKRVGGGLGLTVSRMLCRRMGSDLNINSVLGKGSCFSFAVIYQQPDTVPPLDYLISESEVPEDGTSGTNCFRGSQLSGGLGRVRSADEGLAIRKATPAFRSQVAILVVDDNELNRFVARGMIKKIGYFTAEAENGRDALAKLETLQTSGKWPNMLRG